MQALQHIHRRYPFYVALFALACTLAFMVAPASAQTLTTSGTGTRTVIHGHQVPATHGKQTRGPLANTKILNLTIALAPRNTQALNTLIAAQRDPKSPLYHRFLKPAQFTADFGPTQGTVNAVVSFLRGQGLTVKSVAPNRLTISVSGSVATVQNAFAVKLQQYNLGDRVAYAPAGDPSVPSELGGAITSIDGLDNVAQPHPLDLITPKGASGTLGGYDATDLRTAYDMNNLTNLGYTGTGQTIGLFELSNYNTNDISHFRGHYGLGSTTITNTIVNPNSEPVDDSGADEVSLDLEVISGVAPKAALHVYIGPNTSFADGITLWQQMINDDSAPVISNSWGACEQAYAPADLTTLDTIFTQAASQGQTIFSASGDSGAFDCAPFGDTTDLAVDFPTSDPHVTGVGGTTLNTGSGATYKSESAWNCEACGGTGTGGGISTVFARSSYQTGNGVNSNPNRQVPDVAADADPDTGYSVYCTVQDALFCPISGGWTVIGGTSGAAPLWAGVATDIDQYMKALGNPAPLIDNTLLYQIFNHSPGWPAYHDITTGNNLHYNATPGYDLTTGLGTPDVWNLARDMARETYTTAFTALKSKVPISLAVLNNTLYFAWPDPTTGQINLMHTADGGKTFSTRFVGTDRSANGLSLIAFNNTLYVAWLGYGNDIICLMHSSDGGNTFDTTTRFISQERSTAPPSLAVANNTLYIAWSGVGNNLINLMHSSDNGATFDETTKTTGVDKTSVGLSLVGINTTLYVAWSGLGNNKICLMRSSNGSTFDTTTRFVSTETSPTTVSLANNTGTVYLAWTGSGNNFLNFMHSTDGNATLSSATKATLVTETTQVGVRIAFDASNTLFLTWSGFGNNDISLLSRTLTP